MVFPPPVGSQLSRAIFGGAAARQKAREQNSKIDATLTRLYILLSREYVRSVVGQAQPTIDFASIMRERKVVFLNLPASLPEDDKRFLGTILMSEVLHAARHRPVDERPHFSIFVDEFQHFVNSRDFGQLITETRKFGIAATISHQERLGQFSDDKKIQGATATAANKVFFQLSVADAHELAAEFAEEPPTDIRVEQELVTSRSPVWDLLRGHKDPQICAFVDTHIRPLKERLEDISQALGTERLDRMEYLDEAGLYRIDERIERIASTYYGFSATARMQRGLSGAQRAAELAGMQTAKLQSLNDEGNVIRERLRELNKLLAFILLGEWQQTEELSNYLLRRIEDLTISDEWNRHVLKLYIMLMYGNPETPREIIFWLARTWGIFDEEVEKLNRQFDSWYKEQQRAFIKKTADEHIDYITHHAERPKRGLRYFRNEEEMEQSRKDLEVKKERARIVVGNAPAIYTRYYGPDALKEYIPTLFLPPRILTLIERYTITLLCKNHMKGNDELQSALRIVEEFVSFCECLAKRENQILSHTGQYMRREIPSRTEADMVNEVVRELVGLPKYTAYAKISHETEGRQAVWKGKIRTEKLRALPEIENAGRTREIRTAIERASTMQYLKSRTEIEEEIRLRQERWRRSASVEPPPHGKQPESSVPPPASATREPDEPPPIHG